MLAAVIEAKDKTTEKTVKKLLKEYTSKNFLKVSFYDRTAQMNYVGKALEDVNCPENCNGTVSEESAKKAWLILLQPFELSDRPYGDFLLGDFISELTEKLLHSPHLQIGEMRRGSFETSISKGFNAYMRSLARTAAGPAAEETTDASFYELSLLLQTGQFGTQSRELKLERSTLPRYLMERAGRPCNVYNCVTAWKFWLSPVRKKNAFVLTLADGTYHTMDTPPCTNDAQAEDIGITGCCDLTANLTCAPGLVFRTMKHSMQPPHMFQTEEDLSRYLAETRVVLGDDMT